MINPFHIGQSVIPGENVSPLVNIVTGAKATKEVEHELLNLEDIGKTFLTHTFRVEERK